MKSTLMGTAAIAVMSVALASSPAFAAKHHRHMASPSATPAQEQQEEQATAQLNSAQLNGGAAANTATSVPGATEASPAPAQMNSPAASSSGTAPTTSTVPANKDMAPQTGTSTTGQVKPDTTTPPDSTNGEPPTQPKQ